VMIETILDEVLHPANFFAAPDLALEWQRLPAEEILWETFRGQLLPPAQIRARRTFDVWNVRRRDASDEPLLSLKLDREAGVVHVTRAIHCYIWEGYHAGDNVYLSREMPRWVNELVGTVKPSAFANAGALRDELAGLLFQAVVGVSRLPLTSVEAPLPEFSLGKLGYFSRAAATSEAGPLSSTRDLIDKVLTTPRGESEHSRVLELLVRTTPSNHLPALADALAGNWIRSGGEFLALLRRVFDEVALSPHTGFSEQALGLLPLLVERRVLTSHEALDFLSYLLRHLARHLTAYDLITFHHQGANYPDALLLDAALKAYLRAVEQAPADFVPSAGDDRAEARKRVRRRALRQGWLLRRFYEGLAVPDAPTSPGENNRILPPPHVRVPEEQFDPEKRTRKLYDGDPLAMNTRAREVLQLALEDLQLTDELRELGTAVFLDRPLGAAKVPSEPDRTLLFSLQAFSRKIAGRRLDVLADKADGLITPSTLADARARLRALEIAGVDLPLSRGAAWPGKVSLDDVRKVALDFVFLRTSRRSAQEFLMQFDFMPLRSMMPLDFLSPDRNILWLRGDADATLVAYDAEYRKRLELQVDGSQGYEVRGGSEYPVAGMRLLRAWNESGAPIDVATVQLKVGAASRAVSIASTDILK
jgi:hypothetical protein